MGLALNLVKHKPVKYLVALLIALGIWQTVATFFKPYFFPPPLMTFSGAAELIRDGTLLEFMGISFFRVLSGWAIGSLAGAFIGLLLGRVKLFKELADPYIEFFRFIPPIAFVTLVVIWFGLGEGSKIVLIIYTTMFVVTINTAAGVFAVEEEKYRAAQCLGASGRQIFFYVVIPASTPYIFTGMRLAMGNSFMTIVAAEMIAARSGIGYLIWTARNYLKTDWVFVGILTLGAMGFVTDRILRIIGLRALGKYKVKA